MKKQPMVFRPVLLLQAEALCFLVASCGAYHVLFPHHWAFFACLFLFPDLSLLAYFRGPTVAASVVYNLMHNYALVCVVGISAALIHSTLLGEVGIIWIAHISMDRMLGYGLKYPESFKFTHIQSTENPTIEATSIPTAG